MKKTLLIMVMALAVLLTQCKKPKVTPSVQDGMAVSMTITAGSGSKTDITTAGGITWHSGDKIYVGDGTKYIGYLTLEKGSDTPTGIFSGNVTLPDGTTGEMEFGFFYLGNASRTLAVGATKVDVDFSRQEIYADNGKLKNASAQHVGYGTAKGTVTDGVVTDINVTMVSKIASARFSFTESGSEVAYTGPLTLSGTGIYNKMTVNFGSSTELSFSGTEGSIRLVGNHSERYVMLVPAGTGSKTLNFCGGAVGKTTLEDGIESNKFYGREVAIGVGLTPQEYVDLGLPSGLLWAACNLGASKPEEYGDYYAWGETAGYNEKMDGEGANAGANYSPGTVKTTYEWDYYKWGCGDKKLGKYVNMTGYGMATPDNLTTLLPEDDAATKNWGSDWRMPTEAEFQELKDNTNRTWTIENGVAGWKCANKSDATKYIFLPAAGFRYGTSLHGAGSYGYFWSSSLNTSSPNNGRNLSFDSSNFYLDISKVRYNSCPVRPVRGGATPEVPVTGVSLDKTELSLTKGATATLTATVDPDNATNKSVTWSSSATGVATVSSTGVVTAVAAGIATITVTTIDGGKTATCTVTVTAPAPTHETVNFGTPDLNWSKYNLGVDPSDLDAAADWYGWYFMWGSVTEGGDPDCSWAKCPGNGGSSSYNSSAIATWDSSHLTGVLKPEVDAATANWGSGWRMPTKDEWQSLYDNNTFEWLTPNTTSKNVPSFTAVAAGYLVVKGGKNSIALDASVYMFLPASGYRDGTSLNNAGSIGGCWSSSPYSSDPSRAYDMFFHSGVTPQNFSSRSIGFTVRPVYGAVSTPKFTVNRASGTKVTFAPGNLYYDGSESKWKFESSQWDFRTYSGYGSCIDGKYNKNAGTPSGDWGLFGWSGSTGSATYGKSTSTDNGDYSGDFKDWGSLAIGSDAANTWHTLTNGEWQNLLGVVTASSPRDNADDLWAFVTLDNGVSGLVILPDGSDVNPSTVTTTALVASSGAVFLPAAGVRTLGVWVQNVGLIGEYWSSTPSVSNSVYYMEFYQGYVFLLSDGRYLGKSVRLVRSVR